MRVEALAAVATGDGFVDNDGLVAIALAVSLGSLTILKPLVLLLAVIAVISSPRFAFGVAEHLSTAVIALVKFELAKAPAMGLKPVFHPNLEGDGSSFRWIGLVGEGAKQVGVERLLLFEGNVFKTNA